MEELHTAPSKYASYKELFHHVKSWYPKDCYNLPSARVHTGKCAVSCTTTVTWHCGPREVVPVSLHNNILARLNDSHCGVDPQRIMHSRQAFG